MLFTLLETTYFVDKDKKELNGQVVYESFRERH